MKILHTLILGAAVTGLMTVPAMAGHHEEGEKKSERHHPADLDGDGFLSKAEFLKKKEAHFDKMDANGDGLLSKEERQGGHKKAAISDEERKAKREKRKARRDAKTAE